MASTSRDLLDLTRDLGLAASMGTTAERVNQLLGESLDTLGNLVPFDLATIMELRGEELSVRLARGPLANQDVTRHRLALARFPAIRELLDTGVARAFSADDHQAGDAFDGVLDLPHGHSCMVVPLPVRSETIGIMTFDRQTCGEYPDHVVKLAEVFGRLLAVAMSYGEQSTMLRRLRDQLTEQNRLLGERVEGRNDACSLLEVSQSPAMVRLVDLARQVAATATPVLITGETGTGKEVLANAIHGWSPRADKPLVGVNCAALPASLIESELFGHVKGAFSGATARRMGRFQAANGGTLFLDEIAELPVELQAKLLRVLQEGCFEPVGSDRTIKVDVRIIAATNAHLQNAVREARFREDLYYRLAVFPLQLPPLRERPEDTEIIARSFLTGLARRSGHGPWHLSEHSRQWLRGQVWRGNVRELVNTLERATIINPGPILELGSEPTVARTPTSAVNETPEPTATPLATLQEMERRHIEGTLRHTGGKLYGPGGAAELLGINPSTLRSRMRKLGLGRARTYGSPQE